MSSKAAPYGTWHSPITSDAIVENAIKIFSIFIDPITSSIYHIEARPSEAGRCVIVDTTKGNDIFGPEWNARSRVEEYGGGAAVARGGVVYFSNFKDCRVYSLAAGSEKGSEPVAVTPENGNHRFADFTISPTHPHLLVAILEDHTHPAPSEVETSLVLINTSTKTVSPLVSGADFYASPRFSPDGNRLVWQEWWHPNMPWQGAEIHLADVAVGSDGEKIELGQKTLVGGVKGQVSAAYPLWVSNEKILFTSDAPGYQNPRSYSTHTGNSTPIFQIPVEKDFSLPAWLLGESYSTVLDEKGERVLCSVVQDGRAVLYVLNLNSGAMTKIESPYVGISSVCGIPKTGEVFFIGGQSSESSEIISLTLSSATPPSPSFKALKSTSSSITSFPLGFVSVAKSVTIKVPPNDEPVYVNFYPPKNPAYSGGTDGEKPPCIFGIHGGPTSMSSQVLNWGKQYFTSRGWAWADVNYGGSCGYGRKYVDRLQGQWGISDVRDCILAAQHLSTSLNLVDPSRVFIRGGSSGGYTVLAAISNPPPDTPSNFKWTGATSLYGVSDLRKLSEDTHKFESKYLNGLIGGSYEEVPEVYKERSPISHVDKIDTPLLILQGSEDAVVPPSQAEIILHSLEERGKKVKYILFQGEGHGWMKAENIKAGLEAELSWYEALIGVTQDIEK